MKSFFVKTILIIIAAIGLFLLVFSNIDYSDGYRAGRIVKVSSKGALFKTIEGQLEIDAFGAIKGNNQFSQTFLFSVEDSPKLLEELREASLEGERVNLFYKEKYFRFFWKGDTKYIVYKIERTNN